MPRPPRPLIDGKFRCSRCGAWKVPEDFHSDASTATGRHAYCRECDNARAAARHAANPEKRRYNSRAGTLRRKGWTVESYDAALLAQGGACANPRCLNDTDLMADHDHATGLARVILCHGCNCALGFLGEDRQRALGLVDLIDSFSL